MTSRITLMDNYYACLWLYPMEGIIHHQFLQPISGEEFRSVLKSGLQLMQEQRATKWLSDDRSNTNLPAEDSAWSQDYWLPRAVKSGWEYWAMMPPAKARGRINVERLFGFVKQHYGVTSEIFTDPEGAWQWLVRQG